MIYLFDKDEKLIKIVKKEAIKTALQKFALTTEKYVSDRLTVEMKALSEKEFDAVEYMAIQSIEDAHTFHYFYIAQKFSENLTTLIGVQSGIEELRKSVVLDKRPHNTFARPVIDELLAGTNWQARFVSETSHRSTNFYYISTFEALKKVCQVWNLEMQFFVEVNGNKIGARYIDFKQKIGEATGKRVVYGHNALQILQEVERTNLFTALIGRGKGEEISSPNEENTTGSYGRRITFEDIVWDVKKGNPVDKPKGQKYVELPEMTKRYGIKNADGSMRAKIGFAVFEDEEDKNVLIKRTYDELVSASRPQLTLKTSTVYLKNVKIGDTIRVVRHDKKLDYDTRIFEITFNRLNDESSDIKLGDRISESNEAKIQNIASQKADELISSSFNGLIKNLPEFLPSADGLNRNWYGSNDPTKTHAGKVVINDIWFKPNPEHEGQTILLRWTGEVWEEIIRSNSSQEIIDEISKRFENFNISSVDEIKAKAEEALKQSGANKSLAEEAKQISEQAKIQFASQFAEYTQSLDGRLANISTQIDGKVNLVDFQRVQETSKLYERIIGSSESDIAEKVARMALTNQLFQVEVGKYANVGGPNMLRNSRADDGLKHWTEANGRLSFTAHTYYFNGQKRMFELRPGAVVQSPRFIVKRNTDYVLNILGFDNNSKYFRVFFLKRKKGSTEKYDVSQLVFNGSPKWTNGPIFDNAKAIKKTFKFNVGDFDDGYLQFEYERNNPNKWGGLFMTELDFYEGSNDRKWQPAPEDATMETDEAVRTVQSQLAGSWAVQNLNSAGDLISGINLGANGHNRFDGKLTHITGETLIDNASIKSAAIESIRADQITTGTLNASLVNIINLNANNVTSGTFRGLIFEGGIIRGNNGNTEINLNNNITTYRGQAGIRFESRANYMVFSSGGYHAFLSPTQSSNSNQAAWAIGVAGKPDLDPNENFVGLKIFNGPYSDSKKLYLVGNVHIVKDSVSRYTTGTSLEDLIDKIQYNFIQVKNWFKKSNLGGPGLYDIKL